MAQFKNKTLLLVGIIIVVTLSVLLMVNNSSNIELYRYHANVLQYDNIEELQESVDLVLEVQVIGDSQNIDIPKKTKVNSYQVESPYAGYTTTKIMINRVLKEDPQQQSIKPEKTIRIVEPMYQSEIQGKKAIITFDDYSPLVKGNKYILFLTWQADKELYEIHALSQGKYNIAGTDASEQKLTKDNRGYQKLREQVLDKY